MLSSERLLVAPNDLFAAMIRRVGWLCFGGALAGGLIAAVSGGGTAELPKFQLVF